MAALSVISSPPGRITAGTWRSRLTWPTASAAALLAQGAFSTTR